jgi:diguanylate cyclase (GGDEF)-like protein
MAVVLALAGNVQIAVAATPAEAIGAIGPFIASYLALALFGLNPKTQALFTPAPERPERLSLVRLILLGLAIAITPTLLGAELIAGRERDGLLLIVSSVSTTVLVVARIAQLSAQRDRAERALRDQATLDPLTGLPNRREFQSRLDKLTEGRARPGILFCDIDRFKAVNDQYGHAAGDEILSQVADRLSSSVRVGDVVCRYGGDEFVVLLPGVSPAELESVSRRIDIAMSEPFQLDGAVITIGASVGAAMGAPETSAADLVTRADHAMYDRKRA